MERKSLAESVAPVYKAIDRYIEAASYGHQRVIIIRALVATKGKDDKGKQYWSYEEVLIPRHGDWTCTAEPYGDPELNGAWSRGRFQKP